MRSARPTRSSASDGARRGARRSGRRRSSSGSSTLRQAGMRGQQVELLEHEADLLVAHLGQLGLGHVADVHAGQLVAAARRDVQAAQDVHQGRLARAGRTHDRDVVARLRRRGTPRAARAPRRRRCRRSCATSRIDRIGGRRRRRRHLHVGARCVGHRCRRRRAAALAARPPPGTRRHRTRPAAEAAEVAAGPERRRCGWCRRSAAGAAASCVVTATWSPDARPLSDLGARAVRRADRHRGR